MTKPRPQPAPTFTPQQLAGLPIDHPHVLKAQALLRAGSCPFCCRVGLISPISHIVRMHALTNFETRDLLGLTASEPVTPPDWHEERSAFARQQLLERGGIHEPPARPKRITRKANRRWQEARYSEVGAGRYFRKKGDKFEAYGPTVDHKTRPKYLGCFRTAAAAQQAVADYIAEHGTPEQLKRYTEHTQEEHTT